MPPRIAAILSAVERGLTPPFNTPFEPTGACVFFRRAHLSHVRIPANTRCVRERGGTMRLKVAFSFMSLFALAGTARADEVTDWNRIMLEALRVPPTLPTPALQRPAAIVQAAVFDAVNGIERRYSPIHVAPGAPAGASQRAAAVQAAYASLVLLFPAQKATFDQKRTDSLNAISSGPAAEHSESIARGIEWGQTVADEIWAWRSTDGSSKAVPPFLG